VVESGISLASARSPTTIEKDVKGEAEKSCANVERKTRELDTLCSSCRSPPNLDAWRLLLFFAIVQRGAKVQIQAN